MEIAQSQYELENMKYMVKNGEKDPSRGISALWGSIGARGRSYLFEEKETDADTSVQAYEGGDCDNSEWGGNEETQHNQEDPFSSSEPPRRWSLWNGGERAVCKSNTGIAALSRDTVYAPATNTETKTTISDDSLTNASGISTIASSDGDDIEPTSTKSLPRNRWGLWTK